MTELSRSLLAAAREGLAPDAAVAARVRAKVAAAVGASAAAATGSVAAIPGKASTSAVVVKIGAALLAIGVVITVVATRRPARAPEMPGVTVTPREDDVRSEIRVVAPAASPSDRMQSPAQPHSKHASPTPAHASVSDGAAAPDATDATDAADASPASAGSDASDASDASAGAAATKRRTRRTDTDEGDGVSLAREVELIDLAMVSLHKRAPHAALEAIKAYERETHGRGQMAEDAAAIEIEARCSMDLDATAAIARFDRKWPESAQRERIQTACFAKP